MQQQLDRGVPYTPVKGGNPFAIYAFAGLLLALVTWAFSPALFSYCTSDDFLIMSWLKQSAGSLSALAAQFTGPWLGLTDIKYYRPLPMLDWTVQYALWHHNLLAYHIVNFATYGLISLLVFLIAGELRSQGMLKEQRHYLFYAGLCAAIFATYPAHSEVVNWLVGRLDLLASLYLLACLWCHLRWRRTRQKFDLVLAYCSLVLSLLSKENAILVPPLLFLTELFLGWCRKIEQPETSPAPSNWRLILNSFNATAGYWLFLPFYLLIRFAAIHELVGGWGPKMSFYSRPMHLEIMSSLQHTFVPLNSAVFAGQPGFVLGWCLFLAVALAGITVAVVQSRQQRAYLVFLGAWFVLTLLPTYRFFLIDGNLLNSRLAFMSTVPLCLALAIGLTALSNQANWQRTGMLVAAGFVIFSSVVLYANNKPWQSAGLEVNKFTTALNTLYEKIQGDPPVQIIGVPLEKDGVYVCLNAMNGMTKTPFLTRDIENCRMVDGRNSLVPVGFLKRQIEKGNSPAHFYRWAELKGQFEPVGALPSAENNLCYPHDKAIAVADKGGKSGGRQKELKNLNIDCWRVEYIGLINGATASGAATKMPVLSYTNDVVTNYNRFDACPAMPTANGLANVFIFPVGALPNWTFGGSCKTLKVKYADSDIQQIWAPAAKTISPQITMLLPAPCDADGAITLNTAFPKFSVAYDASAIAGCTQAVIQAGEGSILAQKDASSILGSRLLKSATGTVEIDKTLFPGSGTYKIRIQALDKAGKPVGYASDHLLIHV